MSSAILRGRAHAALLSLVLAAGALTLTQQPASADPVEHCHQYETVPVAGGRYIVDNNNYGPGVHQCVSTDGGAGFTVTSSNAAASPPSGPVAYPEIFEGCHWNTCTTGSNLPIRVSELGASTSSWSTTPAPGNYNASYDLWFNSTPTTPADNGQPDGAELMIWLDRQPVSDAPEGTIANVGGVSYIQWQTTMSANGRTWPLIGYRLAVPANAVDNLDLRAFVRDAVVRGAIRPDEYLIAVEAGFEVWSGGTGLRTNSFSSASTPGYPVGPAPSGTPGMCLDDFGGGLGENNPVAIWGCNGSPAQDWTVAIDGTIRHGGMCMGTTGSMVALHTCNGSPYQVWLPALAGGLWNQGSGLCLRDGSSGTNWGTQLDLVTCDGGTNQRWTLPTSVAATPA